MTQAWGRRGASKKGGGGGPPTRPGGYRRRRRRASGEDLKSGAPAPPPRAMCEARAPGPTLRRCAGRGASGAGGSGAGERDRRARRVLPGARRRGILIEPGSAPERTHPHYFLSCVTVRPPLHAGVRGWAHIGCAPRGRAPATRPELASEAKPGAPVSEHGILTGAMRHDQTPGGVTQAQPPTARATCRHRRSAQLWPGRPVRRRPSRASARFGRTP